MSSLALHIRSMENLVFIKTGLIVALIVAALLTIALIIYELRKGGSSLADAFNGVVDSILGPRTVKTPKAVQDFINEPSNNSYVPWSPTIEEDESWPPSWLTKGENS